MKNVVSHAEFIKTRASNSIITSSYKARLARLEIKVENIEQGGSRVDIKLQKIDDRIDELNNRLRTQLMWIIGAIITSGVLTHLLVAS